MGILRNYISDGVPQNNRITYGDNKPLVTRDIPLDFDDRRTPSKLEQQALTQGLTRVDDLKRITQIISPLKSKFIANQTALNLTTTESKKLRQTIVNRQNAKLKENNKERGRNIFNKIGAGIELLGNSLLQTTKIVGSTLAQVPVSGTGLHFVRGFGGKSKNTYIRQLDDNLSSAPHVTVKQGNKVEIPLQKIPGNQTGEDFNYQGYEGSDLGRKYKKTIEEKGKESRVEEFDKKFTTTKNHDEGNYLSKDYVITENGSTVFINNDVQGPNKLAVTRLANANNQAFAYRGKKQSKLSPDNAFVPPPPPSPEEEQFTTSPSAKDQEAINKDKNTVTAKEAEKLINDKEIRVNLGRVSKKSSTKIKPDGFFNEISVPSKETRNNGTVSIPETADGINMLSPVSGVGNYGTNQDGSIKSLPYNGTVEGRDLIKFRFEVVTPGGSNNNPNEKHLYFRAFLDDFNDDYNANWNSYNYLGRAESFYTYGGFERSMGVSFKVAAMTAAEMKPIYQKLNFLASSTAPTYENIFMRGTLTRMTIGDYVYRQPGFISNVGFSWNVDYPFEIAMNRPEDVERDKIHQELPMIMDVKLSFTPIHQFIPTAAGSATKEGKVEAAKYITNGVTENKYITQTKDLN